MQLHEIKPKIKNKKSKRVGRGGKRGTYSGKGHKGQKSRAGARIKSQFQEMVLKFPKRRGVSFQRLPLKKNIITLNIDLLCKFFPKGGNINPLTLKEQGVIKEKKGQFSKIKILSSGKENLNVKFVVNNCLISEEAKKAIEKAGGKIN